MPVTKSAKKALKRSRFLRARNLQFKIPMKRAVKAVRKLVVQGAKKEELSSLLVSAYSKIDRAAKRNIIHHKAAARLKSRLVALIKNKLGIDPFEKETSKKTSAKTNVSTKNTRTKNVASKKTTTSAKKAAKEGKSIPQTNKEKNN